MPEEVDRDEGEVPEELLETMRQAQQLLDALKTDEKPLISKFPTITARGGKTKGSDYEPTEELVGRYSPANEF